MHLAPARRFENRNMSSNTEERAAASPTVFDRILSREIPADIVFEDDAILGFRDITPQAPTHILFIPKRRIRTLDDLREQDDVALMGKLIFTASDYARNAGLAADGYRLVFNCGRDGGQSVDHIHLHLLAGRRMQWPPG